MATMFAWRHDAGTEVRNASRPRKTIIVLTSLSALLIALVLFAQFQAGEILPSFSFTSGVESASGQNHASWTGSNDSLLHPMDHIYRNAQTLKYHFRITSDSQRPDGVLKRIYLVNGAFPGPIIEARSGDRLVIEVENAVVDEPVSLHWHGLSMRGANAMDGAAGITQSPIMPGDSYTYEFLLEDTQYGTFWYHAHDGVQRADGLYGGLVIHEPSDNDGASTKVDDEHLLMIGDWYHQSAREALTKYMHPGAFGLETVPDSMLVNGQGAYNCSNAVAARPVDCTPVDQGSSPIVNLDKSESTIVRIINVGAYAGIGFSFSGTRMIATTVDGGHEILAHPAHSIGVLHPGERVDLRIEPDSATSAELGWLRVTLDETPFKYENLALTSTHEFLVHWHGATGEGKKLESDTVSSFDIQSAKSLHLQSPMLPSVADQTLVLYAITQKLAHLENEPHGFINQTTWKPLDNTPLIALARDQWRSDQFVPKIDYKDEPGAQWIDIVLNNLDEEGHPFHLHGHDFWVLSTHTSTFNWGSYNPFEDMEPPGSVYDLARALKKDTVFVPRRGYAVIRFKANNPGLWMFHCHVLWHLASGMAMSLEVG